MPRDFLPRADSAYNLFAANFCAKVLLDPEFYGVSLDAAESCAAKQVAFANAFALTRSASTRTSLAVEGKRLARTESERAIRQIAGVIRARSSVTPEMRIALGMNPRDGGGRSPRIARPDSAPTVFVRAVTGRTIAIRLSDPTSTGRSKPRAASGATVFYAIGEQPPASLDGWSFATATPRVNAQFTIANPSIDPGTRLWLTAQWFNPRKQHGPLSQPVSTFIMDGVSMARAMRRAA